eukprot:c5880_g1_i1 orf=377-562(-)
MGFKAKKLDTYRALDLDTQISSHNVSKGMCTPPVSPTQLTHAKMDFLVPSLSLPLPAHNQW